MRRNHRSSWSEIEVFNTLSDFALKIPSLYSLTKSVFQYSEGLVQINWGPKLEWESPNRFQMRRNHRSSWSEIEVFNTLSDFALKIPSLYSLTKSVFQYSEGLVQINWGPKKEWESPNRFQMRRNHRSSWSEIEVFNTLSDFALKIPSLYSLTKSVFQYSEGLVQINWGPKLEWESPIGF